MTELRSRLARGLFACLLVSPWLVACDDHAALIPDAGPPDAEVDAGSPSDHVAALLEPIRASRQVVALGAAVVDLDGVVVYGATGTRRAGGDVPVSADDVWHLGSDTKAMTATLAAIMVERGDLTWETTVAEVFTSFAAEIDPSLADLTLVELLTHRAGLEPDLINVYPDVWARLWELRDPVEGERLWFSQQLLSVAPPYAPRSTFLYSNTGYMIAGAMLEQVSGESWETLIETLLFDPLGMSSCGFSAPASPGMEDQPWGHSAGRVPVQPGPGADNPPALGPAGTVHCSLADWARFIALHLRGAEGDTELLHRASFERLQADPGVARPPEFGYAYGWLVVDRSWAGGTTLMHTGSNTMFYAVAWLSLARGRAYLAVTNQADDAAALATDDAVGALLEAYPPAP